MGSLCLYKIQSKEIRWWVRLVTGIILVTGSLCPPVSFPSFVTVSTTLINFSCAQFVSPVFCYPVGILAICIHPLVSHSQLPDTLALTDMKLSRHFPEFPMASCFYFSVMFKVVHQVLSCILPGRLADLQMFDSASLVLHLGGGDILP